MQEKTNDMDGARQMAKPVFYAHTANSGSRSEQMLAASTVFVNVFDKQGGALALSLWASCGPTFSVGMGSSGFLGPSSKNGLPKWLFFLSLGRLFGVKKKTWNPEKTSNIYNTKWIDQLKRVCFGICFSPEEKTHCKSAFFQSGHPSFFILCVLASAGR